MAQAEEEIKKNSLLITGDNEKRGRTHSYHSNYKGSGDNKGDPNELKKPKEKITWF